METRLLSVPLSDSEWRERAARMARKRSELDRVTEEKKERMAVYKARLDGIQADISKLARAVETQAEDRDVPIEKKVDTAARMLRIIRLDTNAVVEERALTLEEMGETPEQRQAKMPWAEEPAAGETRDEATGAATGAPRTTILVHPDDWDACAPPNRARLQKVLDLYTISFAPVDGFYRTTPLAIGGHGLAAFEHVAHDIALKIERGDVVEAVNPAPEGDEAGAHATKQLHEKIAAAATREALEEIWVEVENARDELLISAEQYDELEDAWDARAEEEAAQRDVAPKGNGKLVKLPKKGAKKGEGAGD